MKNNKCNNSHTMVEKCSMNRSGDIEINIDAIKRQNEARSTTLRGISHDLKSPLSTLSLTNDLLAEYIIDADTDNSLNMLTLQRDAIESMDKLINTLMNVSSLEYDLTMMNNETIFVDVLQDQISKRLEVLTRGKDIHITVDLKDRAPEEVHMDRLVLNRVLDNLLTNAAKYTPDGSINIEIGGINDFIVFKIKDTGIGIETHRLKEIFKPEMTPRDKRGANSYGIGLSVVLQLVYQVGGFIDVMSEKNRGTTFWIYLPVHSAKKCQEIIFKDITNSENIEAIIELTVTVRKFEMM